MKRLLQCMIQLLPVPVLLLRLIEASIINLPLTHRMKKLPPLLPHMTLAQVLQLLSPIQQRPHQKQKAPLMTLRLLLV
ncbi:uncharacterized protein B0P05DRAFT_523713, partial [Gilbertella persicaria]|uniref:uncharacterized protein n=1 Tax=Gilbertella persicaria TaxID=101096 RepID=UPI00221F07F3